MDDYDEFGNYIGPDSDSDNEQPRQPQIPQQPERQEYEPLEGLETDDMDILNPGNSQLMPFNIDGGMDLDRGMGNQVILHEDKKYYPLAREVYGEDVETMVQEEDAMLLSQPIVEPIEEREFTLVEKSLPITRFDRKFMLGLMRCPEKIRNAAVVGHLHSGKTALFDMLTYETHQMVWDSDRQIKYTDTHKLSVSRGISIKSTPMTFVLPDSHGTSHLLNLIDTPGHPNFVDEVCASVRLSDGIICVVDVVEGVCKGTEMILRHAVSERLPITLVINKVDRLILELRLPPQEAYYKIRHTIEEVNSVISSMDPRSELRVSPEKGNVCFASTDMAWAFTLKSFARIYADTYSTSKSAVDADRFAARLWGNIYYNSETGKFSKSSPRPDVHRTFIQFVLEPLWKLYSQVLGEETDALKQTLDTLGISITPIQYKMDVRPLLKLVLGQFFGPSSGLIDMVTTHIPSPVDEESVSRKIASTYTGEMNSPVTGSMLHCDSNGPLIVQIAKLYQTTDALDFNAFGRIISGTARKGMKIKVLGEGYSPEDEEDMVSTTIENLWVTEARYVVEVDAATSGNLILFGGVSASISKTATIVEDSVLTEDVRIFKPLSHLTQSVLKVAVEPIAPSELPKMLEGLRKVNKSYPLLHTKVEESGEHIIVGTGELYLDCVMHDLRVLFSGIQIKVSDPVTRFCETVIDTSALKCYAQTPNNKNKITVIAEPLEKGIAEDIEGKKVTMKWTPKALGKHFETNYDWDLLASRNIWSFGPDGADGNVLIDDTLPSQIDKKLLGNVKESIKQGFQWGAKEGPLCDEPMRGVKFRLLDASLASEAIYRGGGQIIPTSRRVCYSSFLMATPRLMEPVYSVEVQAPADCVSKIYDVLARRRGHVTQDMPKAGSSLYTVKALIPVIDANGFETDLRTSTEGQAFCTQTFDHWAIVPGDPLDSSIQLRPLEPAIAQHLARDLMLKTRLRKGLGGSAGLLSKYLDSEFVLALAATPHADLLL